MKLAGLIQDGAVFQRELPIVVWGWCAPYTHVMAEFNGVKLNSVSASDGRFEVRFPPMAAGGPYELSVRTVDDTESVRVRNILIGEVWLASGQSNMEFPLDTFVRGDEGTQLPQYLEEGGNDPWLRMATVQRASLGVLTTQADVSWIESNSETAGAFSAVGAWFALYLRKRLGVPVGIIHSSWGGTVVHAWMSREALMRLDCTRAAMLEHDVYYQSDRPVYSTTERTNFAEPVTDAKSMDLSTVTQMDSGNTGVTNGWAEPSFDDSGWKTMTVPGNWMMQGINCHGATWVRCVVDIPEQWLGKDLILHLGGVDKHDVTYFNGEEVGRTGKDFETQYWCMPRRYIVPARLVHAGKNTIAIRAFSFIYDGGFVSAARQYWLSPVDHENDLERAYQLPQQEGVNTVTSTPDPLWKISLAGIWKAEAEYGFDVDVCVKATDVVRPHLPEEARPFNQNQHAGLFNGMIHPLIPYTLRGAIWYQGENDAAIPQDYVKRLGMMVTDWRYRWGEGDFPFYAVQLANYSTDKDEGWLHVQNDLFRLRQEISNADAICSTDIGEEYDIHPHDKRSFGYRLAQVALNKTYGCKDVVPLGPTLRDVQPLSGGVLKLTFDWADGLHYVVRNDDGYVIADAPLSVFEVAGSDGVFQKAKTEIQQDGTILVSAVETVPAPCYVRYNWDPCTRTALYNSAELPMATFNTLPWA